MLAAPFLAHTHLDEETFQPAGANINADLLSPPRYTVQLLTTSLVYSVDTHTHTYIYIRNCNVALVSRHRATKRAIKKGQEDQV